MELRRRLYLSTNTTNGSTQTVVLSPEAGSETQPGDLGPLLQITLLHQAPAGSCARFWQTPTTCGRFEIILRKY